MKKATVRDLRYRFHEIEVYLKKGGSVAVYKRKKMIGRLLPVEPDDESYPDFAALGRKIFGSKKSRTTGTDLVSSERGSF